VINYAVNDDIERVINGQPADVRHAARQNRQEAFSLFLTDGRVAIDNNPAERVLRPSESEERIGCLPGRTPVQTLARAMTIIKTAKLNGLDPQAYLANKI